jgi:hypothetical protein
VQLIPDPGDIDQELHWSTIDLARARRAGIEPDEEDLAEVYEVGRQTLSRFLSAMDESSLLAMVKKTGKSLTKQQEQQFIEYARQQLRDDPLALDQPPVPGEQGGQLNIFHAGTNLETALLISDVTGAFPYTTMRTRWRELVSAHDELSETARIWSPLAKTFQSLDFRFLNNVDIEFAKKLRDDGRLEGFRSFLRTIGKGASDVASVSSLDAFVRDSRDALIGEHQKATAEWDNIQESFVRWVGSGVTGAIVSGTILPTASALSAAMLHTLGQLFQRHLKRARFRKTNPMSVFIDLSEKQPKGKILF